MHYNIDAHIFEQTTFWCFYNKLLDNYQYYLNNFVHDLLASGQTLYLFAIFMYIQIQIYFP